MYGYRYATGQIPIATEVSPPRPAPPPPPMGWLPPPPPPPAPVVAVAPPAPPKKKGGGLFGKILHTVAKVAELAAPAVATVFTGPAGGAAVFAAEKTAETVVKKVEHGAGADTDVAVVNPVWLTLAQVLNEVSMGFRLTSTPRDAEEETFLRVVEHLAQVVNGLALAPSDPDLIAEYEELTDFLGRHPDSEHLGAFVQSHPDIVSLVASAPIVPSWG